jgi:hypothetical protein
MNAKIDEPIARGKYHHSKGGDKTAHPYLMVRNST